MNPMQKEPSALFKDLRYEWTDESERWTWAEIVDCALALHLMGEGSLNDIYEAIALHPKSAGNRRWKGTVRRMLRRSTEYIQVDEDVWGVRDTYWEDELAEIEERRRERERQKDLKGSSE